MGTGIHKDLHEFSQIRENPSNFHEFSLEILLVFLLKILDFIVEIFGSFDSESKLKITITLKSLNNPSYVNFNTRPKIKKLFQKLTFHSLAV